jgi:hypothetical protein
VIDPAAAAVDEPLGSGQYRYVATRAWWMATFGPSERRCSFLGENIMQVWIPADESQEWLLERRVTGRRKWLAGSPQEAAAAGVDEGGGWPDGRWRAPYGDFFGAENGDWPGRGEGCWQIPTSGFLAALPRDPARLYERLETDSPHDRPAYTGAFVYAADALRSGRVPADLRAALYRAMLLIPGVTISEAGDPGQVPRISLSLADGMRRSEIFISGSDGQFAGERDTLTRDTRELKAGTVRKSTTIRVATVDTPGQLPAGQ